MCFSVGQKANCNTTGQSTKFKFDTGKTYKTFDLGKYKLKLNSNCIKIILYKLVICIIELHCRVTPVFYLTSIIVLYQSETNHISSVMVSMLVSSVVDHGVEPRFSQTKGCKIVIYCFSDKHGSIKENEKRLVGCESG